MDYRRQPTCFYEIADFAAINSAAAVRSNSLHIKYNELKQRVNAAQTVEEVEAIYWPED